MAFILVLGQNMNHDTENAKRVELSEDFWDQYNENHGHEVMGYEIDDVPDLKNSPEYRKYCKKCHDVDIIDSNERKHNNKLYKSFSFKIVKHKW